SFENITPEEVMFVQNLLNMRPRKSLNYKTPMEEFLNIKVALGTGIHLFPVKSMKCLLNILI
ncbi:hypothetical protein MUP95_05305, partial [bacterium]|nr:hypothetical protein [bacterium]